MKNPQTGILIALAIAFIAFLCSCTKETEIIPTCDWIEVTQEGDWLRLKIHSESPFVTACHEYEKETICFMYSKDFYDCLSISVSPDRKSITFTDKSECVLIIN